MIKPSRQSSVRQSKILELIAKTSIETQEELVEQLKSHGYNVTQATVSRDIKELGLTKILENGKYKYAYLGDSAKANVNTKLINILRESVISIENAGNLIVIKTLSGSANAAAMVIDKLNIDFVLGSIAGDDTLLVVVKSAKKVQEVVASLRAMMH
ncbi:MAG: arginine repressor [Clostridiales bacterium]|jgi:transcriptional regulator of arginine metabolism|nr:arginine repressor [Clostridiales bacterium]